MFLESGEIDNQIDWAGQSFADDQVFLSSNLEANSMFDRHDGVGSTILTLSKRLSRSFRAFVRKWSASDPSGGPIRNVALPPVKRCSSHQIVLFAFQESHVLHVTKLKLSSTLRLLAWCDYELNLVPYLVTINYLLIYRGI